MRNTYLSFEEILEETGLTAKWEARGETKGEARGEERKAVDIAQKMITLGLPFETIVSTTGLDPEKVKTLYQNL